MDEKESYKKIVTDKKLTQSKCEDNVTNSNQLPSNNSSQRTDQIYNSRTENLESINHIPQAFLESLELWKRDLMSSIDQKIMMISQRMASHYLNQAVVQRTAMPYLPNQIIYQDPRAHQDTHRQF